MRIVNCVRAVYSRVRTALELRKYTPYTMAEHLRKSGAQIGERCFIVPTDFGSEPYLVKVGNHVAIAGQVSLLTHDGAAWLFREEVPDLQVFGPIVIEDNCFIGRGATLCPNIRIGPNSVVAANSVVISDVPPNTLVMGVPARPFGSLDRYREKCLQSWAQQRPPDTVLEPAETWWNSVHSRDNRERLKRRLLALFHDRLAQRPPAGGNRASGVGTSSLTTGNGRAAALEEQCER